MKTGICSVTFREKSPEDIINIVSRAGLQAIEWGGDVHVPPGDLEHARRIAELTRKAGLVISSYGSYYNAGNDESFYPILETAQQLGTTSIRIWAGVLDFSKELGEIDQQMLTKIVADVKKQAQLARDFGMTLHLEYHRWTYTDTPKSAKALLEKINEPNVYLYWQPAAEYSIEERIESIELLQQWISNVHVFQWDDNFQRYPLEERSDEWVSYMEQIQSKSLRERYYLLEFVKDDAVTQFREDAETLIQLLSSRASFKTS